MPTLAASPRPTRARRILFAFGLMLIVCAGQVLAAPAALWVSQGRLTPQARQLLDAMRRAEGFGLSSADFAASLVDIDTRRGRDDAALDAAITDMASRFVRQLHEGRVDPRAAGYQLSHQRAPIDMPAALHRLASTSDVAATLASFEPQSAQFRALGALLTRYRSLPADLTALPPLPKRKLEAGDGYAGSERLRALLARLGDAPDAITATQEAVYDEELAMAVARFQSRHGLTADGILGTKTFAALVVPLAQRVRQIELTMERWRWLPPIEAPAVIVNVPQYVLYTLAQPTGRIPVIVGESAKQTPIFDSAIESVVFRPYWNVPRSILRDELLPQIVRDPGYVNRHEYEIVRGDGDDAEVLPVDATSIAELRAGRARLRQRPGPGNALGLIKFVLPNPYSVYLHSTPQPGLFARDRRALSHGCIRVSDASALAAYVLAGTEGGWDADTIEAATCGTETFTVRLARPVPIYILYGTVVVDADGQALFFDDVYGYDRKLEALLRATAGGAGSK